jgi:hypothetical protein
MRAPRKAAAARLKSIQMADTLYLSLWYPNLRLEALPDKLVAVLGAFAAHGGEAKVYSATVWPVSWNETPVFERVYGRMIVGLEPGQAPGVEPRLAVEEAMELLHEDYAYEFQIGWNLWELETGPEAQRAVGGRTQDSGPKATTGPHSTHPPDGGFAQGGLSTSFAAQNAANSAQDDNQETDGLRMTIQEQACRGPRGRERSDQAGRALGAGSEAGAGDGVRAAVRRGHIRTGWAHKDRLWLGRAVS